jgi:hypothetical protein
MPLLHICEGAMSGVWYPTPDDVMLLCQSVMRRAKETLAHTATESAGGVAELSHTVSVPDTRQRAEAYAEAKAGALGESVAALQAATQVEPLGGGYDMAVETLALACFAATQLARQARCPPRFLVRAVRY